jgi:hypothetical protein
MSSHESISLELTRDELRAVVVTLELARLRGVVPDASRAAALAVEKRAGALYAGRRVK